MPKSFDPLAVVKEGVKMDKTPLPKRKPGGEDMAHMEELVEELQNDL